MEFKVDYNKQPEGILFGAKLCVAVTLMVLGANMVLTESAGFLIFGILILGAMFTHCIELQHQCLHYTAFKSRRLNRIVGFILGLPSLVSFSHYQFKHLHHHRYLGTEMDGEFFSYQNVEQGSESFNLIFAAFDYRRIVELAKIFAKAVLGHQIDPKINSDKANRIRHEYLAMLALIATATAASVFLGAVEYIFLLWLLPLVLVAEPLHFFVELPEHFGCQKSNPSPFFNTRSITSNKFLFWFTNGNNLHVEHHLFQNAPISELPKIHEQVRNRLRYSNQTYVEFFKGLASDGDGMIEIGGNQAPAAASAVWEAK